MELDLGTTGIRTTRLGFGCSRLMRIVSAKGRQEVLHAAFDAGIRHFDVARMYGLGATEGELGRFLKRKRDQVIIATKFGITPNSAGRVLARVQVLGRLGVHYAPFVRRLLRRTPQELYAKQFTVHDAERSLNESLRELRTDYVDLLFLHEPSASDYIDDDLNVWLDKTRQKGKIRAFGISGEFADVLTLRDERRGLCGVAQFPSDTLNQNADICRTRTDCAAITFGVISPAVTEIRRHFARTEECRDRWRATLGFQIEDTERLGQLMVAHALKANPSGVVLFSSTRVRRITDTATLAFEISIDACAKLENLLYSEHLTSEMGSLPLVGI